MSATRKDSASTVDQTAISPNDKPTAASTGAVEESSPGDSCNDGLRNLNIGDTQSEESYLIPPFGDRAVNEFEILENHFTQIRANLEKVRMAVRYHANRPDLGAQLKLDDIDALWNDVKTRVVNHDISKPHKNLRPIDHLPEPAVTFIDTPSLVVDVIDCIMEAQAVATPTKPALYMDCEGVDLGRDGTLTLVQLYIPTAEKVYIVDVQTLGGKAFSTVGIKKVINLKTILESETIVKVMWDCRCDSDALKWHFDIVLRGVLDAQLAHNATRKQGSKAKLLFSIDTAAGSRLNLDEETVEALHEIKRCGQYAMEEGIDWTLRHIERVKASEADKPYETTPDFHVRDRVKQGLAISAMAERPLHPLIRAYCALDVIVLPMLLENCFEHKYWSDAWKCRVQDESKARLQNARAGHYISGNVSKTKAPDGWQSIKRVDNGKPNSLA